MAKKFTTMMGGEKIYLDDILNIKKCWYRDSRKKHFFVLKVDYISCYFREMGDPFPYFTRNKEYSTVDARDKDYDKLMSKLNEHELLEGSKKQALSSH